MEKPGTKRALSVNNELKKSIGYKSVFLPEDCRPYRKRQFGELQPMHEIAKQLDLAFTRLYKEGYDVAVVRLFGGVLGNTPK